MCTSAQGCKLPGFDLPVPGSPGKQQNLCRVHYRALWERNLVSEHSGAPVTVPLAALGGANDFRINLIAIRNDPDYLAKSFLYTVYKAEPLRPLRNRLTKGIVKAATGMSDQEIQDARRKTPTASDGSPTMGHTYVVLQARAGTAPKAVYSFGYFGKTLHVTNPDGHIRLANEQRRSVEYLIDRRQFDSALDEVFAWQWNDLTGVISYNLMGTNCTLFARRVMQAAGKTFVGDKIPTFTSQGLGGAYTPNKTFAALKKKGRHHEWDTGAAMAIGAANAAELHDILFGAGG